MMQNKMKELSKIGLGDGEYGCAKAALNAYTPGWIATDLTKGYAERQGKSPAEVGMKTPEEGARVAVHLMMGQLAAEETGRYYGSDVVRSPLHKYRSPGAPAYNGEFP